MYPVGTSPHNRPIPAPPDEREFEGDPAAWSSSPSEGEEPASRLNVAKGTLIGLVLGTGSWVAIFALIRFLRT